MTALLIVFGVIGAFTLIFIISDIAARKGRFAALMADFGKPPPDTYCEFLSISKYAQYIEGLKENTLRVDEITWNDLDMDKVFKRVNVCLTSVGEEYLYNCLHELPLAPDGLLKREQLIKYFQENPDKRMAVQGCLARVGKESYNGLPYLLFYGGNKMLKYPHVYRVLAVLPFLAGGLMFFSMPVGFFAVLAAFLVNLVVYMRTKSLVDAELPTIGYLTAVLKGVKRLCKHKDLQNLPDADELRRVFAVFKPVMRKAPSTATTSGDLMDSMFQYINILFLYDIRKYNTLMTRIVRYREDLRALYRAVGEVDLALCVL